jgi:hypothetical protein
MPDEILTLPEVALLLKVAEKTVYTMAQGSQLPASRCEDSGGVNRRPTLNLQLRGQSIT